MALLQPVLLEAFQMRYVRKGHIESKPFSLKESGFFMRLVYFKYYGNTFHV